MQLLDSSVIQIQAKRIAFTANVRVTFVEVLIRKEDRKNVTDVFAMSAMTLKATSLPCSSTIVMQTNFLKDIHERLKQLSNVNTWMII